MDGFIGPLDTEATVAYSFSSGSADLATDVASTDGILTFGVGETSKLIEFSIIDDSLPEIVESFSVRLLDVSV